MHELAGELNKESVMVRKQMLARTLSALGQRLGILDNDAEAVLQGLLSGQQALNGPSVAEIEALIAQRDDARERKDFARSDQIRDELAALGIVLEDANGQTTWRKR